MKSTISRIPNSRLATENPINLVLPPSNSFPDFLRNDSEAVIKSFPHSLRKLDENNLRHATLNSGKGTSVWDQVKKVSQFVIVKIVIPLFSFTALVGVFVQIQITVNDYCFYPGLCKCKTPLVFFYTIIKELIFTQAPLIIIIYYCTIFVTNNFFNSKRLQTGFYFLVAFLFMLYLIGSSAFRWKKVGNSLGIYFGLALFVVTGAYVLISALKLRKLDKELSKRAVLAGTLFISLFFHRVYFKEDVIFVVIDVIKELVNEYRLFAFKLFLAAYYVLYAYFSNRLLFLLYERIEKETELSYNILIFSMKFVNVDVYSVKSLNALTIPLTEAPSWFFFFWYFYSIFSTYSRKNFLLLIFQSLISRFKRGQKHHKSSLKTNPARDGFEDLKAGCIFETNLIVFLRIITYKVLDTFLIFSNKDFLYQDCTLREIKDRFRLYDGNIILMMTIHTAMMIGIGIFVYALKWKSYLFDYQIERMTVLGRFIIFLACFAYADYSLQIYKAFTAMI